MIGREDEEVTILFEVVNVGVVRLEKSRLGLSRGRRQRRIILI